MGGEKYTQCAKRLPPWGSPPRGRGKGPEYLDRVQKKRITPAWAGKRSASRCKEKFRWDHPRVGGEKPHRPRNPFSNAGSPPRGRGKAMMNKKVPAATRITPAWAGKSRSPRRTLSRQWDHPRVGGEKMQSNETTRMVEGSPPRGRGKGGLVCVLSVVIRITPAWAGKSSLWCAHRRVQRDHPRVGGEKRSLLPIIVGMEGSPPRGRGKGVTKKQTKKRGRITPAWAGKSWRKHQRQNCTKDHPRVGGEKEAREYPKEEVWGSPPRGRGKGNNQPAQTSICRITPAWAGKSVKFVYLITPPWDHPRVGGEKTKKIP